jgi:membrane-associated phospholipid phosphatase
MSSNSATTVTLRSIACRLKSEWGLKLLLLFVLNLWVYLPYLFLERHHFFSATTMPLSVMDRRIPFWAETVWIYLSIHCLMPIGPFLINQRQQLIRYAAGIVLIGLVADVVFIFWPTTCPRPDATGTNAIYRHLVSIDNSFHAFPSLHAAFAIYSARVAVMVVREINGSPFLKVILWLWAFLILLATLTTKQHVIVDIIAGSTIGAAIYSCVFNERIFNQSKESALQSVNTNLNSNTS